MASRIHRFFVGDLECIVVLDMQRKTDVSGVFPHIDPDALAQATLAQGNSVESVPFCYTPMLIRIGAQWLMLDTGNPPSQPEAYLRTGLHDVGITPQDIDIVMITHCHGDHIGGLINESGMLTYPNARYLMAREEWDGWMNVDFLVKMGAEYAAFMRSLLLPIQDRLTLFDGEMEIAPGVFTLPMPGHTPGHTGLRLESHGEQLFHIADTAHVLMQLAHPEWSPRFDRDPEQAAETRWALWERAARETLQVAAYHFPFPGIGHVVAEGTAWRWQPDVG